jgi:hypothetical protein
MQECSWEVALQFLHREHSLVKQRELDWQL